MAAQTLTAREAQLVRADRSVRHRRLVDRIATIILWASAIAVLVLLGLFVVTKSFGPFHSFIVP